MAILSIVVEIFYYGSKVEDELTDIYDICIYHKGTVFMLRSFIQNIQNGSSLLRSFALFLSHQTHPR